MPDINILLNILKLLVLKFLRKKIHLYNSTRPLNFSVFTFSSTFFSRLWYFVIINSYGMVLEISYVWAKAIEKYQTILLFYIKSSRDIEILPPNLKTYFQTSCNKCTLCERKQSGVETDLLINRLKNRTQFTFHTYIVNLP